MKVRKLTVDDFYNLSVGDIVFYRYLCFFWEYKVLRVSSKRITVITEDDDIYPRRYILLRNYGNFYREVK